MCGAQGNWGARCDQDRMGKSAETASSAIAERSELVEQLGDGFVGRLGFFVFEGNEAAVAGITEDCGNSREVGWLFFSTDGDRGFNLGVDGPWCDDLHIPIGVIGLKISTVEVDTEPVGLVDAFDDFEHLGRCGGDAAMIFECEEDTAGCGVGE